MPTLIGKPRAVFWFIKSFVKKHLRFIAVGFILSFLLGMYWYSGFFVSLRGVFLPENSIAIVGRYDFTNLPISIQNKISFGLTRINDEDQATPAAGLSWIIKDSGKTYDFKLNNNLFWHDGTRFRSFDINYRLKDVEIIALGDNVVEFKLKGPFASLSHVVSQPLFKKGLVGLGAYKVVGISHEGDSLARIELANTKNRDDRIIYKFYNSENEALMALKLKKVSKIEGLRDLSIISQKDDFKVKENTNYHNVLALFFNNKKGAISEKMTRLGLSYALPDELTSGFVAATGPIPLTSWYFNPNLKNYSYNPETAQKDLKDLLEESDATSSTKFKIRLDTQPQYKNVAQKIAGAWKNLGIETSIHETAQLEENYDVFLASLDVSADPDQYFLWHSTQNGNITGLRSPRIDKILEDARRAPDEDVRRKKYQEFQKYLVEENPAQFLYYTKNYTVSRL